MFARVVKNDLQRAALDIHRTLNQAARDAGQGFSRTFQQNLRPIDPDVMVRPAQVEATGFRAARGFSAGFNRGIDLKSPTVRVRETVRRDTHSMVRDAAAVGTAMGAMGTAAATAGQAASGAMNNAARTAGSAANSITSSLGRMGGAAGTVFKFSGITVGVGMLADVAKAAVTASQSIWLMPAAIAGAVTGFAALKIGAQGFGDALKEIRDPEAFATALQSLSPNAQQAALSIRALLPAWDALKSSVQDALFANVGQQLNALSSQYLPTLQGVLSSVAGSFNTMFQGVSNTLLSNPELVANIGDNLQRAFQAASSAAAPFTEALLRITSVGSDFLPRLASGISEAASSFATFIADAAQSGKLEQWINDGITAAKELGSVVWDIGKKIMDAFGSSKPEDFKRTLDTITSAAGGVLNVINGVRDAWEAVGNAATGAMNAAIDAVNGLLSPLQSLVGTLNTLPGVDIPVPVIPHVGAPVAGTPTAAADARQPALGSATGQGIAPAGPTLWGPGSIAPVPGGGYAVPAPPPAKGGRGGSDGPVVPYGGDPMALLRGAPVTASTFSAAQAVAQAQADVAQRQADLSEALKSGTGNDVTEARNKLAKAQEDQTGAQLRLAEALQSATKSAKGTVAAISDVTASLDPDFGISKGLGGIVENLIKGVATLAAAPLLGKLSAIKAANPNEGSGLVGIGAAQGLFGAQYTPAALAASNYAPRGGYSTYPGDSALLSSIPAGRYSQSGSADLVQGLGDCSSAVEDLVNIMDGQPTTGRSMSTGNASSWLQSRGFMPGAGGPGDFRVAFNPSHMQATLPGGTPFNWGSAAAAARGGVGGTGADDPSLTSQYYRPQGLPSMAGGPLARGMPQGLPMAQPYAPTIQPQAGPGWQPQGGGGGGGILGAAMGAAGMGLDMLAPGSGAAAQIAMQAIQRTIQYGASVGGSLAQGALDFLSVSDPDGGSGSDLGQSWLGRVASGLVQAAPALPATAGKQDKQPQQQQPQQPQQGQGQSGPPTLHIENFNQSPDRQGVQPTANDLAYAAYGAGMR
ncbi:DUF1090 family protein [Mycolicibacterium septicum]|uniref:DUF1090 family protein n=1 Tax=Mycolicibacterium septicum TaxID=98668 RepID=A0ABW9LRP6_9MYCO